MIVTEEHLDELVAKLRATRVHCDDDAVDLTQYFALGVSAADCLEAAAAIEKLTKQVDGLVKALKPFVRHGSAIGAFGEADWGPFWIMTDTGHRVVPTADFLNARAALQDIQ